jgi:hypothetical protein
MSLEEQLHHATSMTLDMARKQTPYQPEHQNQSASREKVCKRDIGV